MNIAFSQSIQTLPSANLASKKTQPLRPLLFGDEQAKNPLPAPKTSQAKPLSLEDQIKILKDELATERLAGKKNTLFRKITMVLLFIASIGGAGKYYLGNINLISPQEQREAVISIPSQVNRLTAEKIAQEPLDRALLAESLNQKTSNHETLLADYTLARTVGLSTGRSNEIPGGGVILTKDGYILTNAHVVKNVETVHVMLNNSRIATGEVITRNFKNDFAIVKVNPQDFDLEELPTLAFANPKDIKPGQRLMAVGHPFGLVNSVTTGTLSSKNLENAMNGMKMIQTDTALNPGNSGGSLVNEAGELVGMNTFIFPFAEGVNFAISAEALAEIVPPIIATARHQAELDQYGIKE